MLILVMETVSTAMSTMHKSHDSGRTVPYPDLYVLTNDDHRTMTPETHKCAAAAGSFCFVAKENGDQQDICNLTTMPSVQRSFVTQ